MVEGYFVEDQHASSQGSAARRDAEDLPPSQPVATINASLNIRHQAGMITARLAQRRRRDQRYYRRPPLKSSFSGYAIVNSLEAAAPKSISMTWA